MDLLCAVAMLTWAASAGAASAGGAPALAGIRVEFLLFAATLTCVALLHNHTLAVGLSGLAVITSYELLFAGFHEGAGAAGLLAHLRHEWVIVANLFALLVGFAALSKHFEDSHIPALLPRLLPDDWTGGLALLGLVFVLSSFLDNIAAALIGGTVATTVFRGRVHVGYLAAIVGASNAGGSGSVVGDTTTTMMWIGGIRPFYVLHAYVAAIVALAVLGIPAALMQQRYSPIVKDPPPGERADWVRAFIVAVILASAIVANVTVNLRFPEYASRFPFIGVAVWVALLGVRTAARAGLEGVACRDQGQSVPAVSRLVRVDDAGGRAAGAVMAHGARTRLRVRGVRQHSADQACHRPERLRLGHARLYRGLRRLDGMVRLLGGGGAVFLFSASALGRRLVAPRLADRARLPRRLRRAATPERLESRAHHPLSSLAANGNATTFAMQRAAPGRGTTHMH